MHGKSHCVWLSWLRFEWFSKSLPLMSRPSIPFQKLLILFKFISFRLIIFWLIVVIINFFIFFYRLSLIFISNFIIFSINRNLDSCVDHFIISFFLKTFLLVSIIHIWKSVLITFIKLSRPFIVGSSLINRRVVFK